MTMDATPPLYFNFTIDDITCQARELQTWKTYWGHITPTPDALCGTRRWRSTWLSL